MSMPNKKNDSPLDNFNYNITNAKLEVNRLVELLKFVRNKNTFISVLFN